MAATIHTERHDGADYDIGGEDRSSLLCWMGTITGPTSYAQGGIDHPDLPSSAVIVHVQSGTVKDYYVKWAGAGIKFEFWKSSTNLEGANTTDLTTMVVPVTIYYRK